MYVYEYKNATKDSKFKKERSEIKGGSSFQGTEMQESYGWGESFHQEPKKPLGFLASMLQAIFSKK